MHISYHMTYIHIHTNVHSRICTAHSLDVNQIIAALLCEVEFIDCGFLILSKWQGTADNLQGLCPAVDKPLLLVIMSKYINIVMEAHILML